MIDSSGLTGLLNNAALIIALGVIYDALNLESIKNWHTRKILSGFLVGLIGLAVMNTTWEMAPGIIFDTRWVLISVCGLFFGIIPTIIAGTMMLILRIYIGGPGIFVGSLVIIIPAVIGLLWRYTMKRNQKELSWFHLYFFGLVVQVSVLGCLLLMPESVRSRIINVVWFPLIAFYPIGTMLLGLILRRQKDRRIAEIELEKSRNLLGREQSQLHGLINSIPDPISFKDMNGHFLGCNHAFEKYTGVLESSIIGKTAEVVFGNNHLNKEGIGDDNNFISKNNSLITEEWVVYPDDRKVLHETVKNVFYDLTGSLQGVVRISRDITEQRNSEQQIRNLAFYDPLTDLPNRRLLLDRLNQLITASSRSNQFGALLFIDLDNFKNLNDTRGHSIGDQLLIAVATRLKSCLREADSIARIGGDEFVATIANLGTDKVNAASMAESIAEKIRLELCLPYELLVDNQTDNLLYHSTPSIGVSLFRADIGSVEDFIKQADVAMYQAKRFGRNRIRFFDPVMQETLENSANLLADLHNAVPNNEFELYYQVQIDENIGIVGAEALIRWHHPTRGLVSPYDFISLAEESELIIPIGRWVMETACQQLKKWEAVEARKQWQIAVNVSALQIQQKDFVQQVEEIVLDAGIDPSRLKIELTESMIVADFENTIEKMKKLSCLGIQFSMDDFGTGQSSLSSLKRLPLSQIKIDQSFVRDIDSDTDDMEIIKLIIGMASTLNYNIIAEGVETDSHKRFLVEHGCSQYQGYLFSRPVPINEFDLLVDAELKFASNV